MARGGSAYNFPKLLTNANAAADKFVKEGGNIINFMDVPTQNASEVPHLVFAV
jgi:hypothetical protein